MYEENKSDICCCEYINYEGEKAHVLAALCDCQLIDNMAERCISSCSLSSEGCSDVCNVIQDRLRVPWCIGGAQRLDLQVLIPSVIIPICICIAAQGLFCTLIVFVSVAVVLFILYGWFLLRQYKTNFFLYWFFVSFLILMGVFQMQIVPFLEIQMSENLFLMLLVLAMLVAFYFVKSNAPPAKTDVKDSGSMNLFFNNLWTLKRDRYCIWMNCPLGVQNHFWFILGLILQSASAFYVSNLIYTTLCQPVSAFWNLFLIPYDCSEVYSSFYIAISFVSGIYASVIGFITSACAIFEVFVVLYTECFKRRCLNLCR